MKKLHFKMFPTAILKNEATASCRLLPSLRGRRTKLLLLLLLLLNSCSIQKQPTALKAPDFMLGTFTDDYKIKYRITDSVFIQLPNTRFHIIRWNKEQQYLIARNDNKNPTEKGLYTRIDYMQFSNMEPYKWGFCLTEYKATSDKAAEAVAIADRSNPKKGCNGFPFSRMKRTDLP